ncbi:MAG: hypothetical protein V1729_05875 [Candidatus Woesearchaeota archaeon]
MVKQISELEKRALAGSKIGAAVGVAATVVQTLGYGPVAECIYDKLDVSVHSPGIYDMVMMSYAGSFVFAPVCIISLGIVGGIAGAILPSLWKKNESIEDLAQVYPVNPPKIKVGGEIEGLVKRTYGRDT